MKFSLAILCLLAPSGQAVVLKNKHMNQLDAFPTLPSGQSVTNVLQGVAVAVQKELPGMMYQKEKNCWNGRNGKEECHEYERGLRRDLQRANRDIVRGMEEAGIDFSSNVYDPQFITDMIEAEYGDFVQKFMEANDQVSSALQEGFDQIKAEAARMGLSQVKTTSALKQDAVNMAVADNTQQGFRDCDQERWGGNQQCPQVPAEQMECPGPCCWRPPVDAHEEATFRAYDQAKEVAADQCYLESKFVLDVFGGHPPPVVTQEMATQFIQGVAGAAAEQRNISELAGVIREVNSVLEGEAKRLAVNQLKPLPNPRDTANKISQAIVKLAAEGAKNMDEVTRSMNRARSEGIREVWKIERDAVRSLGVNPFDQKQALEGLNQLKREIAKGGADREFEQGAGMINEFGGNTSKDEVKRFAADTVDTLIKTAERPDYDQQVASEVGDYEQRAVAVAGEQEQVARRYQ